MFRGFHNSKPFAQATFSHPSQSARKGASSRLDKISFKKYALHWRLRHSGRSNIRLFLHRHFAEGDSAARHDISAPAALCRAACVQSNHPLVFSREDIDELPSYDDADGAINYSYRLYADTLHGLPRCLTHYAKSF